jgi:hypothetical protein
VEDPPVDAPMRRLASGALVALLALAFVLVAPPGPLAPDSTARALPSYGNLAATVLGPANVGLNGNATYTVNVTGGPAVAANGTQVGIYSYNASVSAGNTTNVLISPSSGSIINGTVNLTFKGGNLSQQVTIYVAVTSSFAGANDTVNASYSVNVIVPYRFAATIVTGSGASLAGFNLTVFLDGAAVGQIIVGTLAANTHYPISFNYVDPNIAPGWHTFSVSLSEEHGLISFLGGAQSVSESFYVTGPAPNYEFDYAFGIVAFVGVAFILLLRAGGARRPRTKK